MSPPLLNRLWIRLFWFLNILFQAHGLSIPRNARDQFKDCDLVEYFEDLPLGGFVFLKNDQSTQISHVMLKKSPTHLIHAVQNLGKVVLFSLGVDIEFKKNKFYTLSAEGKAFLEYRKKKDFLLEKKPTRKFLGKYFRRK